MKNYRCTHIYLHRNIIDSSSTNSPQSLVVSPPAAGARSPDDSISISSSQDDTEFTGYLDSVISQGNKDINEGVAFVSQGMQEFVMDDPTAERKRAFKNITAD